MLLMAVWPQNKENDEEHLFIVKNYCLVLFVLPILELFLWLLPFFCVTFLTLTFV